MTDRRALADNPTSDAEQVALLSAQLAEALAALDSERCAREAAERMVLESQQQHQVLLVHRRSLLDIARAIMDAHSAEKAIEWLRTALPALVQHSWFGLYWLDPEAGVLRSGTLSQSHWLGVDVTQWDLPITTSIAGHVLRSGRGELVNNAHHDPRAAFPPGATIDLVHAILMPVHVSGTTIGVLALTRSNDPGFSADEFELVQFLVGYLALAIANSRLFEQLTDANRELRLRFTELSALKEIARTMTLWTSLPEALQGIGWAVTWLLDRSSIGIWQLSDDRTMLSRLAAVVGEETTLDGPRVTLADEPATAEIIAQARPKVFAPTERLPLIARPPHLPAARLAGGCMILPLQSRGNVIGLLGIRAAAPQRIYTQEDLTLAQAIADILGNALESGNRFEHAQVEAAEEERRRLARELHDSVSQALFHANMTAAVLPQLWDQNVESGRRALNDLQQMTQSALAEMRMLLIELRPHALINTPLNELLKTLATALSAKGGIPVAIKPDTAPQLPPDVQIALYRIAQESINNIIKHAQAHEIRITLKVAPAVRSGREWDWSGEVILQIDDDGRGFEPSRASQGRIGLGSMRERASGIGAVLQVASKPDQGTHVKVSWSGSATQTKEDA